VSHTSRSLERKEKAMTNTQITSDTNRAGSSLLIRLKLSTPQDLRRFLEYPWSASLLTPAQREELFAELLPMDEALQDRTEAEFIEVGRD
jgi:hypothetical protein